ncbi:MAG: alpha/beta hydrolase-fold protein, partial [bacterium]
MRNAMLVTVLILLSAYPVQSQNQSGPDRLPALDREIVITDWWIVGPMQSGSREPLANPMGTAIDPDTGAVDLSKKYMSLQAYGGKVGWTKTTADENGTINFKFDDPDWDKIVDEWGAAGAYFTCAAYAVFEVSNACRALANAQGIGSFSINGRLYSGDPYGHGVLKTPVLLDEGENRIFFFSGGYGGEDSATFKLESPPTESLMIFEKDCMLPDIVRGKSLKSPSGLTILNTTNEWIRDITLTTGGDDNFALCSNKIDLLAPLSVIKIPVDIELKNPIDESWEDPTINIPVSVGRGDIDEKISVELSARVRNPGDSIIKTFISRNDNSCQKYAVRYPVNYDPSKEYGLVLALHGAGVECEGMADAFESEDWAFIVNPTNRRRFGFDWQDWGRLDAIEILDLCTETYPIDPNRVCLIGHSMGGHGTWHIGCTHADRFACIVPSAGW